MTSGYTILGLGTSPSSEGDQRGLTSGRSSPSPAETAARDSAVAYLDSLVGVPYVWGGKDPAKGLDCSGAATVAYEKAGFARPGARYKYGSADLHKRLTPTSDPKKGDLAFYGPNGKVNHVMMVVGDGRVIGATGGGKNTKNPDDAMKIGAHVKYKPVDYRKDLISYGRAPSVYATLDGTSIPIVDTSDSREDGSRNVAYGLVAAAFAGLGAFVAWRLRRRSS